MPKDDITGYKNCFSFTNIICPRHLLESNITGYVVHRRLGACHSFKANLTSFQIYLPKVNSALNINTIVFYAQI